MSEENKKKNNDSSRKELNEELKKVKNEENSKKTGVLDAVIREIVLGSTICCYSTCPPPLTSRIWHAILGKSNKESIICPDCHVELQADPVKKNELQCPKCGKRFTNSDLSDSD